MARPNIIQAIENGDRDLFLRILDEGVKAAVREASAASHALGLDVADPRAAEDLQPKRPKISARPREERLK